MILVRWGLLSMCLVGFDGVLSHSSDMWVGLSCVVLLVGSGVVLVIWVLML